MASVSILADI